jgi:AcrR family transcriptional regulator
MTVNQSTSQEGGQSGPVDTRESIIQGAARVFSRKGYAGATTREIAAEAGVNEVTIFRHFGKKKNLLLAVIERFSALPGLGDALKDKLTGDYRQDLTRIAQIFMEMMARNRRVILMTMCEAQRSPEVREIVAQLPARQRQMLGQYLRQQIEAGVVRKLPDPELTAQAFFALFFEFNIAQTLWEEKESPPTPGKEIVAQLVDIFVRGTIKE